MPELYSSYIFPAMSDSEMSCMSVLPSTASRVLGTNEHDHVAELSRERPDEKVIDSLSGGVQPIPSRLVLRFVSTRGAQPRHAMVYREIASAVSP